MKGTKYLSELISENDFQTGKLNLLVAPCGSGKTTLFLKKIAGALPDRHKMLYLIDTTIGNNYLIRQHVDIAKFYDDIWFGCVSDPKMVCFEEKKVVIITYAKFGWLVRQNPDFGYFFDYIICDEFHNCYDFARIPQHDDFNAPKLAQSQIQRIAEGGSTKVIAITATPALVETQYGGRIHRISYDEEAVCRYETQHIIPYTDNVYWLNRIAGKGVIFTPHVEKMKELQVALGSRAIAIWSLGNTDHTMNEEQLRVRDYIIEHERVPDEYDYLIINKSAGTAITLQGRIDFIVVNVEDPDVVEQVRGRYRDDLDTLYIKDKNALLQVKVPSEYLNIKLSKEQRSKLCSILGPILSSKPIAWPTMEKYIQASGYTIQRGKTGNTNYRLIKAK